jgi:hypothetical protein
MYLTTANCKTIIPSVGWITRQHSSNASFKLRSDRRRDLANWSAHANLDAGANPRSHAVIEHDKAQISVDNGQCERNRVA